MTQQEQARLQILNNLLAGYMTTEQAATLDGSERTPHQAHASGLQRGWSSRTSSRQSRSQTCQRYTERIGERSGTSGAQPIRRSQPYAPERVAQGAGGHRHRSRHVAQDTDERRCEQSSSASPAEAPRSAAADATRGYADTGRRQLPQMAGRRWTAVHAAACSG